MTGICVGQIRDSTGPRVSHPLRIGIMSDAHGHLQAPTPGNGSGRKPALQDARRLRSDPRARSHAGAVADDGNEQKLLGRLGLCARVAANGEPVGSE